MSLVVAKSPRFQDHDPGLRHPERPERIAAIQTVLKTAAEEGLQFETVEPQPIETTELRRVHSETHLQKLDEISGQSAQLDPDTATSPQSVPIARLAAGTTLKVLESVATTKGNAGMSLVRPPGHHAVPERAMGFCLINNLAVAAKSLLERGIVERIAIYDWDVHHGNGTQAIFYNDPRVLYMSTHQWPFYPGTGSAAETGQGAGEGTTVNVPLPEGTNDDVILRTSREFLLPRVKNFSPDLVLISAGYDGHISDPLGGFMCSTEGFRELAKIWRDVAEHCCHGRIAGVLEGGYHLDALSNSVRVTLESWA
ncbi:MAG: histone deacetylase [Myxococcales bacterium]|nr:histone deacetylase [Myxococcales bacterium]